MKSNVCVVELIFPLTTVDAQRGVVFQIAKSINNGLCNTRQLLMDSLVIFDCLIPLNCSDMLQFIRQFSVSNFTDNAKSLRLIRIDCHDIFLFF